MSWFQSLIIWIKALFVEEVVVEVQTYVYKTCKEPNPRPLSYWAEFAAQLRPEPSVQPIESNNHDKQEAIRLYRDNNKMLNDYFNRRQNHTA